MIHHSVAYLQAGRMEQGRLKVAKGSRVPPAPAVLSHGVCHVTSPGRHAQCQPNRVAVIRHCQECACRYPEGEISNVNVSVVVTNVGADYTKLGSFGTASAFGENLVASMDRRYLLRSSWNRKGRSEQIQVQRAISILLPHPSAATPCLPDVDMSTTDCANDRRRLSCLQPGRAGRATTSCTTSTTVC